MTMEIIYKLKTQQHLLQISLETFSRQYEKTSHNYKKKISKLRAPEHIITRTFLVNMSKCLIITKKKKKDLRVTSSWSHNYDIFSCNYKILVAIFFPVNAMRFRILLHNPLYIRFLLWDHQHTPSTQSWSDLSVKYWSPLWPHKSKSLPTPVLETDDNREYEKEMNADVKRKTGTVCGEKDQQKLHK